MNRPASDRPVALLARRDLRTRIMSSGRGDYWTVQDPVSLRSYRLRREEHFVLQLLDGTRSLTEIKQLFDRQFAPRRLASPQLQSFLKMLHGEGLITADAEGQGDVLLERSRRTHRQRRWRGLANPLAVRLPGVNPDRFLDWLLPKVAWWFSPAILCLSLLLVLSALVLAFTQWERLQSSVAELSPFLQTSNAAWFLLAIGASKMLHELGHALTCKRLGGRCHEIGIMFLVFVPCLYCNVSDAWLLPNKWRRMAVSAAGMAVELCLAAVCLWIWWYSAPGPLHNLCLAMTVVCSVNTLLINGNPLLRFDGYYLLADFVEIPNLGQAARSACGRCWDRLWFGSAAASGGEAGRDSQRFLVSYGAASWVYRWLVLAAILAGVYAALKPYGLAVFAQGLGLMVLGTAVVGPTIRGARSRIAMARRLGPRQGRRAVVVSLLFLSTVGLLFVPFAGRVKVPARVAVRDVRHVFVGSPGFLRETVRVGQAVDQGDALARLDNFELARTLVQMEAQYEEQALHVRNLRRLLAVDDDASSQLPSAEAVLADLGYRLQQLEQERHRLTLTAPRDGVVLPPPTRRPPDGTAELVAWEGTPLDEENAGAFLAAGSHFCSIGDPRDVEAVALIEQGQINRIRVGQQVSLRFQQLPAEQLHGTVVELAQTDLALEGPAYRGNERPDAYLFEDVPTTSDGVYFQARIRFQNPDFPWRIGGRGVARITVQAESLATWCYRGLRRTFSLLL